RRGAAEENRRGGAGHEPEGAAHSRARRSGGARRGRRVQRREARLAALRLVQRNQRARAADRQFRRAQQIAQALRVVPLLLLLALAAGCGGAKPVAAPTQTSSQSQSKLADAEGRAAALMRTADLEGAARQYGEAARIAATVENADAVAANSINQSIVYQWLGRDADARDALSRVLDDPRRPFPERRRLQAELRRAIVDLALQNPVSAATFAERAEKRCGSSCEYAATILNVQAQIALESSRTADAE